MKKTEVNAIYEWHMARLSKENRTVLAAGMLLELLVKVLVKLPLTFVALAMVSWHLFRMEIPSVEESIALIALIYFCRKGNSMWRDMRDQAAFDVLKKKDK